MSHSTSSLATAGVVHRMLTTHRAREDVPPPNWEPLPRSKVFDANGVPNVDNIKQHLQREGLLHEADVLTILRLASALLREEPNVLRLSDPITVCGDIHGQYFDLLKLLELGGDPATHGYLFLGDYVDRGCFGVECVLLLMALKIRHRHKIHLLRGNHECRHLTAYFNMRAECWYKYSATVYDAIMATFDTLPLACVLNKRFLCVHGGISPELRTIEDIDALNRFREPPTSGLMCDLLWADPMEEEGSPSPSLFDHNELRSCSYVFSHAAVCQFLGANQLLSVIRAHEAQDEGYRLYKKSSTGFPSVVCIFSAPNYCDIYDNKAAIIRFERNLMNIRQFNSSAHPYYLPNFMNAFTWSLPFMAEKVADLLGTVWQLVDETEQEGVGPPLGDVAPEAVSRSSLEQRSEQIRAKVLAMGKMARMFRTLREENESIVELKGLAGGHLPVGVLQQGPQAIRHAITGFQQARKIDLINEKRPKYADT